MAPARLAGQYSIMMTPRGPGTLYVLSIPYKLLGDKGVPSAELMNRLYKSAGGFSAQKPNVVRRSHLGREARSTLHVVVGWLHRVDSVRF